MKICGVDPVGEARVFAEFTCKYNLVLAQKRCFGNFNENSVFEDCEECKRLYYCKRKTGEKGEG